MGIPRLEHMLSELRAVAQPVESKPISAESANGVAFNQLFRNTLENVSRSQIQAHQTAQEFSLGTPDVSLQDVMINLQKANLAFQQVVQVRNRLVSAYHDIMNMQV